MHNQLEKIHVWEKIELKLTAKKNYDNPYKEVDVWVNLTGPDFNKRVYGFWDGDNIFKIRILATAPGDWSWISGSNQDDPGLNGVTGNFTACEWTEEEKEENPCRRGMVKADEKGHSLVYADDTPCFLLGDTWWATPTFRFPWYDDDIKRPVGPEMGFKDMVRYRKEQGFNCIAMLAGHPTWANDGRPASIKMDDEDQTAIRSAWKQPGTNSAEDMHNEGGRPFQFPGKVSGFEDVVPDFDRINPSYFQYMDRKVDYLNAQGFIPFIELARRDISQVWKKYYQWPESYGRYIQYLFSRYQANNCILSPIHFDTASFSIPSIEYNEPIEWYLEKYGAPPFDNLISTNAAPSNYRNFGGPEHNDWLTLYQIGNGYRMHYYYWYLTEIFRNTSKPCLNGEPYYANFHLGFPQDEPPASSKEDDLYCRSGMYGSVLSGGLAGHIYGADGIWQGAVEEEASVKIWEALTLESAEQFQYLRDFIMSEGERYQDLIPNHELVFPSRDGDYEGYTGWAYCAGTKERDFFLLYFEKDCPQVKFRGTYPGRKYKGHWFNPKNGKWIEIEKPLTANKEVGIIRIPKFPSNNDWGLKLVEIKGEGE